MTESEKEARDKAYLEKQLKMRARQIFEASVPPSMRAEETNWQLGKLADCAEQISKVRDWQYGPKGLLLSGPTGRGKTRSLYALMQRLACDEGREVRIYHATDWFTKLQSKVNYGRDEADGWVSAVAKSCPVLVIDDLGQEAVLSNREEWSMSWFFRLLDLRLQYQLPIFVTTNLPSGEIAGTDNKAAIRNDPLLRRLLELCEVVRFG